MKFKSQVYTQTSGSVGGLTYSRNKGGMYCRARRIPVNPNTAYQATVKNLLSQLQTYWQALNNTQRNAWAVWAANMTFTNVMGDAESYTPVNCYILCNLQRLQAGLSRIDAAPVIYELAQLTPPVMTITAAGTTGSLAFTNTDAWATEVGGALLIWASRAQQPTINYFKGPYRYTSKVAGAVSPPTSPSVLTLPFPSGPTGSRQFFKAVAVRADGRPSPIFLFQSTV